jgi:hypothetical protein
MKCNLVVRVNELFLKNSKFQVRMFSRVGADSEGAPLKVSDRVSIRKSESS